MAGTAGRSGRRPKPTARKALAGNLTFTKVSIGSYRQHRY